MPGRWEAMVVMDVKKIMLLIGALVVAAVTAVMAKNMFTGSSAPTAAATPVKAPTGPEILVATRSLPVGTIIDAEALKFQPWPAELVDQAYFVKGGEAKPVEVKDPKAKDGAAKQVEPPINPAELVGTVVRTEITAGQPITRGALIRPGERGFLAAALGPGMRAVTVPISEISGVAGFIFPGDRVDMMLIQEIKGVDSQALKAAETIVRNLRVLSVDQRTVQTNKEGRPIVAVAGNVTVEVTPRLAEKIQVAQTIGKLSLTLRSLADNQVDLERAIASGDVKVPEGTDPEAERAMLLEVASRPSDGTTTYSVGADVSRFQRRSVPLFEKPAEQPKPVGPKVNVARAGSVTQVQLEAK